MLQPRYGYLSKQARGAKRIDSRGRNKLSCAGVIVTPGLTLPPAEVERPMYVIHRRLSFEARMRLVRYGLIPMVMSY